MRLKTKHFGEIEIAEDKVINFPMGLVAFEEMKRFILIKNEDKELPFHWLQSVDNPDLAFVVTDPFWFKQDYEFDLPEDVETELAIEKPEDVAVFAIVVVPEDLWRMTANLLAPVVINTRTQRGRQVVLNDARYSVRHPIMESFKIPDRGRR